MSDGDEKKPAGDDEDFSFLDELGDLIDEDLDLANEPVSDGADDAPEVSDDIPDLTEDAAEIADVEIDLSEDELESAPSVESFAERDDDVLEFLEADANDGGDLEAVETPSVDLAEDADASSEQAVEEVAESVPFEPLYELEEDHIEPLTADVAEVTAAIEDEEIVADLTRMDDDEIPGEEKELKPTVVLDPTAAAPSLEEEKELKPTVVFDPMAAAPSFEEEQELEPSVDIEPTAVAPSFEEADLVDSEEPITALEDEIDRPVAAAIGAVAGASASLGKEPTKPFDLRKPETYDRMPVAPAVPRSRSRSRDLLKVGIGLVLGAIALQFAVWWGLGQDPLGLSKLAPSWILPGSLKSDSMAAAVPRSAPSPNSPTDPDHGDATATDEAEFVPGEVVETNVSPTADGAASMDLSGDLAVDLAGESTGDPAGNPPDDLNVETNEVLDPLADFPIASQGSGTTEPGQASRSSEFAEAPNPLEADPGWETGEAAPLPMDPSPMDPSPFDKPGPTDGPSYSSNDLAAAVAAARASDERLDGARINKPPGVDDQLLWKEALRSAAEEFYRAFADLGDKATFVRRDGAGEALASSRELLGTFEFDDKKQRMIANAARNWIKNDLGRGVFGAASVTGIQPMGDLYQLQLALMGREATPITVVTRLAPENNELARFSVGDRILFLGTMIKNAKQRIEGYVGMEESVIWMTDQIVTIP